MHAYTSMNKTKGIALTAITVMLASLVGATMTLAPMNVKASSEFAFEQDKSSTHEKKDGTVITKESRRHSNENSANAAVRIEQDRDHDVNVQGDDDDGPALTMNKESSNPSGERGIDIQSSENSENSASQIQSTNILDVDNTNTN